MTTFGEETATVDTWDDHPGARDLARDHRLAVRCADHICKAMQGISFNPQPSLVPLRPVILAPPQRSSIEAASRYLARLIHRVCWTLTQDPTELARRVGLREDQVPFLGASGVRHEIELSSCNGRFDITVRDGVPVFIEANFGAANMDPVVAHSLLPVYRELYGVEPASGPMLASEPFEARARLYRKLCRERGLPESVAIIATEHGSSAGDITYYESEAKYLRSLGLDSEFVGPQFFADGANLGRYSIGLKHFMSEYWVYTDIPVEGMKTAHARMVFIVPDAGYLLSSKLIFAWLSAEAVPLSDGERAFVRRHLPWTRQSGSAKVVYDGRSYGLHELAAARRAEFVLKPLNSSGGQGVLLGHATEPEVWRDRMKQAIEAGDHVLQQFVPGDPLAMDFLDRETNRVRRSDLTYVLGSYLVDGISAGNTIRHFPGDRAMAVNVGLGAAFNLVL